MLLKDGLPDYNHLRARVDNITFLGSIVRVQLNVGGDPLISDILNNPHLDLPRVGDNLTIAFSPRSLPRRRIRFHDGEAEIRSSGKIQLFSFQNSPHRRSSASPRLNSRAVLKRKHEHSND